MLICKGCGEQNKDSSRFCYACGAALNGDSLAFRQSSQVDAVSLGNQLRSLATNVDSLEKLMEEEEGIYARIKEPVKIAPISKGRAMKPFIIPSAILGGISLMFLLDEDTMGLFVVFIIPAAILLSIGFAVSGGRVERSARNSQAKYDAAVKEQTNLNARLSELERIKNKLVGTIQDLMIYDGMQLGIPENYFYSDAIQFFADRIISGRSNSLPDAMDAYDAHIHRMKLEQAAYEAAEYQRQSANNLAAIQQEQAAMRRQGAVNTALHVANTIRHW